MWVSRLPLVLAFVLLATACTASGEVEEDGTLAAGAGSLAMVRLERPESSDPLWAGLRAEVGGAFVRYRGIDGRSALALVGGPAVEVGECRVITEDLARVYAEPTADIELVDVGEIQVELADASARAFPRTFPDLAGVVRGAFYAEEATLGPAYAEQDEYVFRAAGVDGSLGFSAAIVAPAGFAELWIDGAPARNSGDGRAEVEGWELVRGADVDVRWDAGDPRDRVEIDIVAGGAELQCAARDDGTFLIPGERSVSLPDDPQARFVVRRTRREALSAAGFEAAWASVASTRTMRVPVR